MKIGVLTYHRVVNVGAALQAISVVELLREAYPNAHVELIDYSTNSVTYKELRKCVSLRRIKLNWEFIKRRRLLSQIIFDTGLSTRKLRTENNEKARVWLRNQNYDLVVVGSDTVWENRDPGYSPKGTNLYFLPGDLGGTKKVGMSVSSDPINPLKDVMGTQFTLRQQALQDFDLILFRDRPSRLLWIETGGGRFDNNNAVDAVLPHVDETFDPVLLNGLDKVIGRQQISQFNINCNCVGVSIGDVVKRDQLLTYFNNNSFKTIDLLYKSNLPTVNMKQPKDIIQTLRNHAIPDLLVTDRFHTSIFTLLQSDSCIFVYEDPTKWSLKNSKIRDLFEKLEISEFVIRDLTTLFDVEYLSEHYALWGKKVASLRERISSISVEEKERIINLMRQLQ